MKEHGDSLSKYKPMTQQLIKSNPHWMKLFKAGEFNEDEALSTMQNFPEIFKLSVIDDIKETFSPEYPSLVLIRKYQQDDMTYLLLNSVILEVENYFNIQQKLNQSQRQLVCRLILQKHYYLNIADLRICFDNAVLGNYGKVYNRISPDVILGWIDEYSKERALVASNEKINESQNHKRNSLEIHPDILKKLRHTIDKITENTLIEEKPKEKEATPQYEDSFSIMLSNCAARNWEVQKRFIPFEEYYNRWYQKLTEVLDHTTDASSEKIISIMKNLRLERNN